LGGGEVGGGKKSSALNFSNQKQTKKKKKKKKKEKNNKKEKQKKKKQKKTKKRKKTKKKKTKKTTPGTGTLNGGEKTPRGNPRSSVAALKRGGSREKGGRGRGEHYTQSEIPVWGIHLTFSWDQNGVLVTSC